MADTEVILNKNKKGSRVMGSFYQYEYSLSKGSNLQYQKQSSHWAFPELRRDIPPILIPDRVGNVVFRYWEVTASVLTYAWIWISVFQSKVSWADHLGWAVMWMWSVPSRGNLPERMALISRIAPAFSLVTQAQSSTDQYRLFRCYAKAMLYF